MDENETIQYDPSWSRTTPHAKQLEGLRACMRKRAWALLMEQGTGKTKICTDRAAALFAAGQIDGVLVVAFNGVHTNWIETEIPKHMPEGLLRMAKEWSAGMGVAATREFESIFKTTPGVLRILAMNIEGFRPPNSKGFAGSSSYLAAKRFLNSGRMLMIVDESSGIKTLSAQRTKAIIKLGPFAFLRMIATGTEITNSPFDIYPQFQFLRPGYLAPPSAMLDESGKPMTGYTAFKNRYADWIERRIDRRDGRATTFKEIVRYRNLDELIGKVNAMSFRASKKDCFDLPPKVFETRPLYLAEEAWNVYRQLVKATMLELPEGRITAPHAITRLLRLQQIAGGFLPLDGQPLRALPNAKLGAMMETLQELRPGVKVIIWARFQAELNAITAALREAYGFDKVVRYWGEVGTEERERAKNAFQDGAATHFVGNQHVGGFGLTLHAASYVGYYSNDFSYEARVQSEDRAHRMGLDHSVTYIDWVAQGTVDVKILRALKEKLDLAMMFKTVKEVLE